MQMMGLPQSRSLDDWYLRVNRIYLDRNFYRDAFSIYAHLVEIVGGLSLLASEKKKASVNVETHVPKALAWWLALCGKVGIKSVDQMLWWKFPYVCPYCQQNPHDNDICEEMKSRSPGPDWARLEKIGEDNAQKRPRSVADWQRLFGDVYKPDATGSYAIVFARFTEELGELGEALRVFPVAPGYFLSEAADVFAWLMHLQNRIEKGAGRSIADRGSLLTSHLENAYPNGCRDCGRAVCACPVILPSTLGRIAHEVPHSRMAKVQGEALLSLEETLALFGAAETKVRIGGEDYELTVEQLRQVNQGITQLLRLVLDHGRDLGAHSGLLVDALHELKEQTAGQRLTEEQLERLASEIADLDPDQRERFMDILRDGGIGVVSSGVVEAIMALL